MGEMIDRETQRSKTIRWKPLDV